MGKAEYMDSWKTKYIFPALGMIPIDRSGGSAAEGALNAAAAVLGQGEFFGIYPEGTRSRDGKLHRGHTGVARLALQIGVPDLPRRVCRARSRCSRPDSSMPRPFRMMRVRIGRPIDTARYGDRSSDRMALRQITDEVMYEIRGLSGQEYVDTYASKQSDDIPAGRTGEDRAREQRRQRGRGSAVISRCPASRGRLSGG